MRVFCHFGLHSGGLAGVWKWDGKARIMPLVQLKKAASITHLVFRTPKLKDEPGAAFRLACLRARIWRKCSH